MCVGVRHLASLQELQKVQRAIRVALNRLQAKTAHMEKNHKAGGNLKQEPDVLIVDFNAVYHDRPLAKVLVEPFSDYAALANVYDLFGTYDPAKVAEIHRIWEVSKRRWYK